ncbi:hypothetical protein MGYG_03635 [Nannizzia gypsea CBS 118893]|uniref:Uncharacterized protein n=1 Tax=Arthroderma gypseum (strain ATCC MYA-4604 / CBS 118893) TaxID=535722 RepID=E4UT16_ARTGP|nr:hypothetical protein MGYG_03635 [Nannizzia gypsea CBS 118893]EFR00629.1 hypothetical protein MGYG_03635 [Nannizzia gypsea CBS 118893]
MQEFPYIDSVFKKILHEIYECSGGLFIELLEGKIWCGATESIYRWWYNCLDEQWPTETRDERSWRTWDSYRGDLVANTYVATDGIDKSLGNFSCYLLLSKPGEDATPDVKQCGLACHHVVSLCNGDSTLAGKEPSQYFADNQMFPPKRLKVIESAPALGGKMNMADENNPLGPITRDVGKNIRIRYPTTQEHEIERNGMPPDNLEFANEEEKEIGTVLASSGLAMSMDDNCRLDWAVVLCKPEESGKNVIVHGQGGYVTINHWARPTGNSEIYLPERGVKGYLNTVKSCVCYKNAGQETRTKEWAVIGGCKGFFDIQDVSGQLVVGKSNDHALGVIWGGTRSKLIVGTVYITPLHVIARSIRETTSYSVSLAGGPEII